MTQTTTSTSSSPQPVKDGEDVSSFDTIPALIGREEFDLSLKRIDERILNTNFIMGVIVVVLFVGFLTLLISVIAIFGQYIGLKSSSDYELRHSIERLTDKIDQMPTTIPTVTPVLTPIQPKN